MYNFISSDKYYAAVEHNNNVYFVNMQDYSDIDDLSYNWVIQHGGKFLFKNDYQLSENEKQQIINSLERFLK